MQASCGLWQPPASNHGDGLGAHKRCGRRGVVDNSREEGTHGIGENANKSKGLSMHVCTTDLYMQQLPAGRSQKEKATLFNAWAWQRW